MSDSDEQLISILAALFECHAALSQAGKSDTAELVSIAILDLRTKLHGVDDAQLKSICEEMMRENSGESEEGGMKRHRPLLRLVK